MNLNSKIGVFDSGIGGATVLKEIIKILPKEDYIYYSDSKNNPYGDRKREEIIQISDSIVEYLINRQCKAIVIACNTASAESSAYLRKKYSKIPIIAIEPAYKMVYDFAYDDPTLIMATKGTTESENFNKLVKKYNNHNTYILPCVGLANAIENDNKTQINECLKKELNQYNGKVKNIVLGCTHYPLIEEDIKKILGKDIKFFNGAPNLASHLRQILIEKNLLSNSSTGKIEFIDSSGNKNKERRFFEIV